MEKYLYKKSYQLNSFKPIRFNDLWGKKGVFTTIRVVSPKRKFIFFASHIANMNLSLTKMNIKFKISQKIILQLLTPVFKKINNKDVLLRIAINTNIISLSLRIRRRPIKNFVAKLYFYKRSTPNLKNLLEIRVLFFRRPSLYLINAGVTLIVPLIENLTALVRRFNKTCYSRLLSN